MPFEESIMSEERQGDEVSDGYGVSEPIPYVPYASPLQHPGPPLSIDSDERNFLLPVPSVLPSSPPTSTVSGGTPAQRKGRRRLWITASIIATLLLASISCLLVIRYVNRPTPNKTLDTFCNALQREDYRSAYDQFSEKLQHTFSEATFATILSRDKVTACTHGTPDDSGSSTTTNLKLVHASENINNDVVALTKDSNNDWKIDDIYQQT